MKHGPKLLLAFSLCFLAYVITIAGPMDPPMDDVPAKKPATPVLGGRPFKFKRVVYGSEGNSRKPLDEDIKADIEGGRVLTKVKHADNDEEQFEFAWTFNTPLNEVVPGQPFRALVSAKPVNNAVNNHPDLEATISVSKLNDWGTLADRRDESELVAAKWGQAEFTTTTRRVHAKGTPPEGDVLSNGEFEIVLNELTEDDEKDESGKDQNQPQQPADQNAAPAGDQTAAPADADTTKPAKPSTSCGQDDAAKDEQEEETPAQQETAPAETEKDAAPAETAPANQQDEKTAEPKDAGVTDPATDNTEDKPEDDENKRSELDKLANLVAFELRINVQSLLDKAAPAEKNCAGGDESTDFRIIYIFGRETGEEEGEEEANNNDMNETDLAKLLAAQELLNALGGGGGGDGVGNGTPGGGTGDGIVDSGKNPFFGTPGGGGLGGGGSGSPGGLRFGGLPSPGGGGFGGGGSGGGGPPGGGGGPPPPPPVPEPSTISLFLIGSAAMFWQSRINRKRRKQNPDSPAV